MVDIKNKEDLERLLEYYASDEKRAKDKKVRDSFYKKYGYEAVPGERKEITALRMSMQIHYEAVIRYCAGVDKDDAIRNEYNKQEYDKYQKYIKFCNENNILYQ